MNKSKADFEFPSFLFGVRVLGVGTISVTTFEFSFYS